MADIPTTSAATEEEQDNTQFMEPSPIERRINEGRSYNDGNWTSAELKILFDGVLKYGTRPRAVVYIASNLLRSRTENEIKVKMFEIREMVSENKEECREYYKNSWLEKGRRDIMKTFELYGNKDMDWIEAIDEINKSHHDVLTKYRNPVRQAVNKVFSEKQESAQVVKDSKITDASTVRATSSDTQDIRWPLINQFVNKCVSLEEDLPALNELEAAIVSNVLDNIEEEANSISEEDKTILCGIFSDVAQVGDMRAFEPDFPPTTTSAVQILVDPLRTRPFGVPELGADPTKYAPSSGIAPIEFLESVPVKEKD